MGSSMATAGHGGRLSSALSSLGPPDLWLVSSDGWHLPSHSLLLSIYSPLIHSLLSSSPLPSSLSLPIPSLPLSLLLSLLSTGSVSHHSVFSPVDILEAAELLGIEMEDLEILNQFGLNNEEEKSMPIEDTVCITDKTMVEITKALNYVDQSAETKEDQTGSYNLTKEESYETGTSEITVVANCEEGVDFVDNDGQLCCLHCEFTANDTEDMKNHMKNHRSTHIFKCRHCGFLNKNKSYLKEHIDSKHTGIRYDCPHCDAQLTFKKDLARHFLIKHSEVRFAQCEECFFKANSKGKLRVHMKKKHNYDELNDVKPILETSELDEADSFITEKQAELPTFSKTDQHFYCQEEAGCPFNTRVEFCMKVHWKLHNPPIFTCTFCDAQHSSNNFMKRHVLKEHLNLVN